MKKLFSLVLAFVAITTMAFANEQTIDCGTAVTVTATADEGYHFKQWNDGVTTASRTFNLTQDTALIAEFAPDTFNVSFNANGGTIDGQTIDKYIYGETTYTLPSATRTDYNFAGWYISTQDGDVKVEAITEETIGDLAFFAKWTEKDKVLVNVTSSNTAYGTVTGSGEYHVDEDVTITATPIEGAHTHFVEWQDGNGTKISEAASYTIEKISTPMTFVAIFAKDTVTINDNDFPVDVDVNDEDKAEDDKYEYGKEIRVTPTSLECFTAEWENGDKTDEYRIFTAGVSTKEDDEFKVKYTKITYTVTTGVKNNKGGSISVTY